MRPTKWRLFFVFVLLLQPAALSAQNEPLFKTLPEDSLHRIGRDSVVHLRQSLRSGFGDPLRVVVKDSATFQRLWTQAVGQGREPPPGIDFSRDMVIVVAMGHQEDPNFVIRIDSVVSRNAALAVYDHLSGDLICAIAWDSVNPADIVKVPRSNQVVVFHEALTMTRCP